mmetsp:Transcript_108916/g.234676  ORF Transcript_108916/g.234676 Transcript_108916/m.234676 type:complete len:97 (+) Transcript_108916:290-580(+)
MPSAVSRLTIGLSSTEPGVATTLNIVGGAEGTLEPGNLCRVGGLRLPGTGEASLGSLTLGVVRRELGVASVAQDAPLSCPTSCKAHEASTAKRGSR